MIDTKLLLATTNQGKTQEIRDILKSSPVQIFSLQDLKLQDSFKEKGRSFLDNARGKSLFFSQKWEDLILGEDSGLAIEYLDGAPGIFSARFSGHGATVEKNIMKVLDLMKDVPQKNRRAKFVSCIVLSLKGKVLTQIQEEVQGFITNETKGRNGFGYDPIFYYPPLQKTFAELSPEEKNKISHRGRSLKRLKDFLEDYTHSLPAV